MKKIRFMALVLAFLVMLQWLPLQTLPAGTPRGGGVFADSLVRAANWLADRINPAAAAASPLRTITWPDPVRPDKAWVLTFTSPVDVQSVTAGRFSLFSSAGQAQALRLQTALDGLSVTVWPVAALAAGEYTLQTQDGIRDQTGRAQPERVEIRFTVAGEPEPDTLVISPAAVTLNPGETVRFTASFSGGSSDRPLVWMTAAPGSQLAADSAVTSRPAGSTSAAAFAGSITDDGQYQAPLQPGHYWVQVTGSEFPNLWAAAVVTIREPPAADIDLSLDSSSFAGLASETTPGAFLLLKARVFNRSAAGQCPGGSTVRFLVNDRIVDEIPFYIEADQAYQDVGAYYYLPMGEYTGLERNETVPVQVTAVLDPYDRLAETSEANNSAQDTVRVRYKYDVSIAESSPELKIDATGLFAYSVKNDLTGDRITAAQPGQRLRLRARIQYNSDAGYEEINVKFLVNGIVVLDDNRRVSNRVSRFFEATCDYQVPFTQADPIAFRVLLSNGSTAGISIPVLAHDLQVRPGDLSWSSDTVAIPGHPLYLHAVLKNMASISFPRDSNRVAWRALVDGEPFAEADFVVNNNLLYVTLPAYEVPADQTEPIQLTVITDVYDQLGESDESNNFATIEIPVANAGLLTPNFYVEPIDLACIATPVVPGAHVTLQATIHSQCAGFPARSLPVDFIINGEVIHKTVNRNFLDPLQAQLVTHEWNAPLTLAGTTDFQVVIDPDNLFSEDAEDDNAATLPLQIARPDLDVTDHPLAWLPSPPLTGQPVNLTAIVKNSGVAPALNALVRFTADEAAIGDATLSQIDGSTAQNAVLTWLIPAVPESEQPYRTLAGVSGKMALPADQTRSYQIRVQADPGLAIAEVREDNNGSAAVTLTATVPTLTKFVYIHAYDVLGDVPSATVVLTAADGSTAMVDTGDDGWCCFTGVPNGRYTFAIAKDGYHPYTAPGATQPNTPAQYKQAELGRKNDFPGLSGPDRDNDLLADADEPFYGTDPDNPDFDQDGVKDGQDLSPTCKPDLPERHFLQKIGMVRFDQPIAAHGLDGFVDVYDMEYHLATGDQLEYRYTDYSTGTRTSDLSPAKIRQAVDRVFAAEHFKSWAIRDIAALSSRYPEKIAEQTVEKKEDVYTFAADSLHRTEYRFNYDYVVDDQSVSLKNFEEIFYPSECDCFTYLLFPVQVRPSTRQTFSFQFTQGDLADQISVSSDARYHELAFQYTFYLDNDFDNDNKVPKETMIVFADNDGSDRFSFTISLPKEKAVQSSYYLKITPIWVDGNNGSVDISPADVRWNLTGLTREIQYAQLADGAGNTLSESLRSVDGFNDAIPTYESVLAMQGQPSYLSHVEQGSSLTYDPAAPAAERYELVEFQLEIIRCTKVAVNSVKAGLILTRLSDVRHYPKVAKLADLPPESFYARTAQISEGINVATGVITLYTNGLQAWRAAQEGDVINVAYYSAKAGTGAGTAGLALAKISTNTVATAGKTGQFALKFTDKVAIGLAVAVCVIEVSYNLYQYNTTTDTIRQSAYAEKIGSNTIDTGFTIATVCFPPLLAFTATWMLIDEVFGYFTDWGLSYRIAQTPGSALVFLYQYWWSEGIPSELAETAYTNIVNVLLEYLRIMNENGVPFAPVFVDPQL